MFDKEIELIQKAKSLSQKEALSTMLKNPELLDPLIYVLFTNNSNISGVLPHNKYCLLMKQKAIKSNNKALLKLVEQYEGKL